MLEQTADRRPQKTQAALRKAFFELIRTKGYEVVSVGDVAAAANVGRSTFYEHFRSKEDMLSVSMTMLFASLADCVTDAQPSRALHATTAHFWENRSLARAVFTGVARQVLVRTHELLIETRLAALAAEVGQAPMLPLPLAARQLAEGHIGLLYAWLTSSVRAAPAQVSEAVFATTRASVGALFAVPATKRAAPF